MSTSSVIVDFYNGTALNLDGRSLDEILQLDAESFGKVTSHWKALFPIPEGSQFARTWLAIDEEVFQAFRNSEKLRGRLNDGFRKALWFFGFQMIDDEKVVLDEQVEIHLSNWDCDIHRNHSLIATILRSLRVLGLDPQALGFFHALTTNATKVRPSALED